MFEKEGFKDFVEGVAQVIDLAGLAVVVVGLVVATAYYLRRLSSSAERDSAFRRYRQGIGRAILLGLEFLVAADIIRTVAIEPTFRGVGVLAIIVLVRTFLSFTLEVELEGRWPWQQARASTTR